MSTALTSPPLPHLPLAPTRTGDLWDASVRQWQQFADHAVADEPLYALLCRHVAEQPALLALMANAPPQQQRPNLLLAALHDLILRDHEEGRLASALAHWYPSVGGHRDPCDPALGEALAAFANQHHAALAALIRQRPTQTNEVGRCAVLRPALTHLAAQHHLPLALFDLGCSAGLNLWVDQHPLRYRDPPSSATSPVAASSDEDATACTVLGVRQPPGRSIALETLRERAGCDPLLLDVQNNEDMRWLRACLWPSAPARQHRLEAAIALARRHMGVATLTKTKDSLAALDAWLVRLPTDRVAVLFHSWVCAYFNDAELVAFGTAMRARLYEAAQRHALGQGPAMVWLSAEDQPRTEALLSPIPLAEIPPEPDASEPANHTYWVCTQAQGQGQAPYLEHRLLARSHPHGRWLQWLDMEMPAPAQPSMSDFPSAPMREARRMDQ